MNDTPEKTPQTPEQPDAACDPYLWDRSPPVDPSVRALEATLEPLRLRAGPDALHNAAAARRSVVVRRTALAMAAMLLIGVGVGWWWTGRPITDTRDFSPWTFVPGRGVTVQQVGTAKGNAHAVVKVRTDPAATVELRTAAGTIVTLGPASDVWYYQALPGAAPPDDLLHLERGSLSLRCAADAPALSVAGLKVLSTPAAVLAADSHPPLTPIITALQGDIRVQPLASKTPSDYRLAGPMSFGAPANAKANPSRPLVPTNPDAPPQLLASLADLRNTTDEKARWSALDAVLTNARPADAPTLWNLAFSRAETTTDADRDRIVNRMGQLLNNWPPAIKLKGKLSPSDPAFADDWWELIKTNNAAPTAKDAPPPDDQPIQKKEPEKKPPPNSKRGK